jgi:hypothetical protein
MKAGRALRPVDSEYYSGWKYMGLKPLEEKLLKQLLSTEELTEARVVYMLVCARKLMEIGGTQYPSLKFHCDWALHSQLDKKPAIKIIKLFDDLEQALQSDNHQKIDEARKAIHRVVNIQNFREEFGSFLAQHLLPNELCVVSRNWVPFLDAYLRVVSDVPLEFTETPIRHIRRVVLKHVNESALPAIYSPQFAFGVEWTLERFDGTPACPHGLNYEISHPDEDFT